MPRNTRWWIAAGAVAFLFVAAQAVPYGHGRTNPPVVQEPAWDSPSTRALARQACFDCHSNETRWPAYARVAPVSWLIQRDVREGRGAMNVSEWHRPQKDAREAAEAVRKGEMPPRVYTLMHADARLNAADRDTLARGLANTLGTEGEHGED